MSPTNHNSRLSEDGVIIRLSPEAPDPETHQGLIINLPVLYMRGSEMFSATSLKRVEDVIQSDFQLSDLGV